MHIAKTILLLAFLNIASHKGIGQCILLEENPNWDESITLVGQNGVYDTLQYVICNPTSVEWFTSDASILLDRSALDPISPIRITSTFGSLDLDAEGWYGEFTIPVGACDTLLFVVEETAGDLAVGDLYFEIIAFDDNFDLHCGTSPLYLSSCLDSITLSHSYDSFDTITVTALSSIEYNGMLPDSAQLTLSAPDGILIDMNCEIMLGGTLITTLIGCEE